MTPSQSLSNLQSTKVTQSSAYPTNYGSYTTQGGNVIEGTRAQGTQRQTEAASVGRYNKQEKNYETPPRALERGQLAIIQSLADDLSREREKNKNLEERLKMMEDSLSHITQINIGKNKG